MKTKLSKRNALYQVYIVIVTFLAVFLSNSEQSFAKNVVLKNDSSDGRVVGKWMAAGSGCQSTSEQIGDVSLKQYSTEEQSQGQAIHLEFILSKYRLTPLPVTKDRPNPSETNYARECAIRVSVQPPKGMRLSSASAHTVAELSKDLGSDLLIQGALKVGAETIASHQRRFEKGTDFQGREEVLDLVPGRNKGEEGFESECGQGRIVGVDLTFLTNKSASSAPVAAHLGRDKVLKLNVGFEPCK